MPLPTNERIVSLAQKLLEQFDAVFGYHAGFRPAHAKGVLLSGTFTPGPDARSLTRAEHVTRASTPVIVRFSNSTGIPALPDNDPNADPRGMAVRFQLGERRHTDIISHAADGFPTRTADEFLEMLKAIAASGPSAAKAPGPSPIERFLGSHPSALAFVKMPKPPPASFAREAYFAVTAYRFTNADGIGRFGRYRLLPAAGTEHLAPSDAAAKGPDYLFDELRRRLARGPIEFRLAVQLAGDGDAVDDATVRWPADRPVVELGVISLQKPVENDAALQKQIIFDPIPRIDGIDPSDDPLLEARAALYLLSGRRRRGAEAM